jgi:hypothetical protein
VAKKFLTRSVGLHDFVIKCPGVDGSPSGLIFTCPCPVSWVPKINCTPEKSGKMIEASVVWIKISMMLTRPPGPVPGRFEDFSN